MSLAMTAPAFRDAYAQVHAVLGEARMQHLTGCCCDLDNPPIEPGAMAGQRLLLAWGAIGPVAQKLGDATARQWFGGTSISLGGIAPGRMLARVEDLPLAQQQLDVALSAFLGQPAWRHPLLDIPDRPATN